MECYQVKFLSMNEVKDFVNWGRNVERPMSISTNTWSVDAKAKRGVLLAGLWEKATLIVDGRLEESEKAYLKNTAWYNRE